MPYVQFESDGDFILEPRCSKFAVGLQMEGRKMGGIRGPVGLWFEGQRVTGAPLCVKCSNIYCSLGSLVVRFVCCLSCELRDPPPLGESASPFIDEGNGLTSERGRVYVCQVLLPTPSGTRWL